MTDDKQVAPPPVFQDRRPLLTVCGILHIFIASTLAVLFVLVVINLIMKKNDMGSFMNPIRMMMPFLIFHLMLIIWFVWMGIGSIKARRWARTLSLVFSWLWLIGGVIGTIVLFVLTSYWFDMSQHAADWYKWMMGVMKIVLTILGLAFFILFPVMFMLVYRKRNIKMTCEFYDRQIRWTDNCPLPVLALVLLFGFISIFLFGMLFYARMVPFFGSMVGGVSGIIIFLVMAAVSGFSAWGMHRLNIKIWWIAVLFISLASISIALTFYKVGSGVYLVMLFPEELEYVKDPMYPKNAFKVLYGSWGIPIAGYLLFVRKYFIKRDRKISN